MIPEMDLPFKSSKFNSNIFQTTDSEQLQGDTSNLIEEAAKISPQNELWKSIVRILDCSVFFLVLLSYLILLFSKIPVGYLLPNSLIIEM